MLALNKLQKFNNLRATLIEKHKQLTKDADFFKNNDNCPVCLQDIESSHKQSMLTDKENKIKEEPAENTDESIGVLEDGREIFKGSSKFGPYVKILENDKWKFAPNKKGDKIKLKEAIELLKFPINFFGTRTL